MSNIAWTKDHIFQSAAVATGNGTAMDVGGLPAVGVQIYGITVATVIFEGTLDDSHWVTLEAKHKTDGARVQSATADGIYMVHTSGLSQMRCRISAYTSGTITIKGKGLVTTSAVDVGQVGGSGDAVSDSITRPANTTQYAANDEVNISLSVSGATNATPIEITTSAAHGLSTGDRVTVASVGGNTAANGNWAITVTSTTKFTLDGSVGANDFTTGGTVAKCLKFANIARSNGGGALVVGALLIDSAYQSTLPQMRLFLFHTQVTTVVDNAAAAPTDAEMLYSVGHIDFTTTAVPGDATAGTGNCEIQVPGSSLWVQCAAADVNLYGKLVAVNTYTPISGEVLTAKLKVAART